MGYDPPPMPRAPTCAICRRATYPLWPWRGQRLCGPHLDAMQEVDREIPRPFPDPEHGPLYDETDVGATWANVQALTPNPSKVVRY